MNNDKEINNILKDISTNYKIPINDLMNSYTKNLKNIKGLCIALKQDGEQCTRRSKINSVFCGKHIVNQKCGCINNEIIIELSTININNKLLYIDNNKIIYNKNNDNTYTIIGKQGLKTNYFI